MRKFDKPFDEYELQDERPMLIELNPKKLAAYEHLFKHPIYYYHCFQYVRGSFYRAVLGYELLWDKDYEDSLVRQLDHTLHFHMERREYYFEDVKFTEDFHFYGEPWRRGVATKYNMLRQQRKDVKAGQRALVRVNLLDKPNHVDIDFDDGSIWSIPFIRYLNFKPDNMKVLNEGNSTKSKSNAKNAKPSKAGSSERPSEEISSRDFPSNVLDLRERIKRANSVQKTRRKVRSRLVR